jgi:RNA polymerase sigma factor (TIGR02999 family)
VSDNSDDITHWLHRWHEGDPEAADRLFRLILPQLKKLAAGRLRHEPNCSLPASEVVNELYEKLAEANRVIDWRSRQDLFAIFHVKLRRFFIDYARRKKPKPLPLDELPEAVVARRNSWEETLHIDRLLDDLEKEDFTLCAVLVASHYYGYENKEIAKNLGLSERTAERYLHEARKWLYQRSGGK